MDEAEQASDTYASQHAQEHLVGSQAQHDELLEGAAAVDASHDGAHHELDGLAHDESEMDLNLDVDAMTQAILAQAAAGFAEMQGLEHYDGGDAQGELDASMDMLHEGAAAVEQSTMGDDTAAMEVDAGAIDDASATAAASAPSAPLAAVPAPTVGGATPSSPRGVKRSRDTDTPIVASSTADEKSQADKLMQEFSTVAPAKGAEAVDLEGIAAVTAAAVAPPQPAASTTAPGITAAATTSVTSAPAAPRFQNTLAQSPPKPAAATTAVFRAGATPTAVLSAPQSSTAPAAAQPAAAPAPAPKPAFSALSLFSNVPPEPGQSFEPTSPIPNDLADDLLDFSSHDLAAVAQAAMGLDENGEPLPGNEESHRALADAMQRLAAPQGVGMLDLYNDNPALAAEAGTSSAARAPDYPRDRQHSQRSEGDWENGDRSGSPPSKRFQCPKCDRAFARAYNLNTHLSTHDPDPQRSKPFPCPYPTCKADGGRSFSRKHDLQRHVASTHENEPEPGAHGDEGGAHATGGLQSLGLGTPGRKFRCDECGRGFVRRDALKRHNCTRIKGSGSDQGSVDPTDLDAEVGATLAAALAQASAFPDAYALYTSAPYRPQAQQDVKPNINMNAAYRPRPPPGTAAAQQAPTGALAGTAQRPAPPGAAGATAARPVAGGPPRFAPQAARPGTTAPFYPNARPAGTLAPRPGQPGARPLAPGVRPVGAPGVRPAGAPGVVGAPRPRPPPGIMPPAGAPRPPGTIPRPPGAVAGRPPASALVRPGVRPAGAPGALAPRPAQPGYRPPGAPGARPGVALAPGSVRPGAVPYRPGTVPRPAGTGVPARPFAPGARPLVAGARPLAPGVARPPVVGGARPPLAPGARPPAVTGARPPLPAGARPPATGVRPLPPGARPPVRPLASTAVRPAAPPGVARPAVPGAAPGVGAPRPTAAPTAALANAAAVRPRPAAAPVSTTAASVPVAAASTAAAAPQAATPAPSAAAPTAKIEPASVARTTAASVSAAPAAAAAAPPPVEEATKVKEETTS